MELLLIKELCIMPFMFVCNASNFNKIIIRLICIIFFYYIILIVVIEGVRYYSELCDSTAIDISK